MVICPDCGKDVSEGKYCKNCGCKLPEIIEIEAAGEIIEKNFNHCANCGFKLLDSYKFCPNCGKNIETLQKPANKSVITTIILSIILPGLGQFYLGLDNKGAKFLIAYVISAILILILVGFLLCIIIWVWALIDSVKSVNALNRGESVEDRIL